MKPGSSLLLAVVLLLIACIGRVKEPNKEQVIREYFKAVNSSDFEKVSDLIVDSIIFSEMEFVQSETKDELYRQFQFDSVFSPHYEINELKMINEKVDLTISKSCTRIRFLHDSAIVYKVFVNFRADKISRIHIYEYESFNFEKWQSRRDALVMWINIEYPELSGFIYDQSLQGALNYMRAIDLYSNQ